MVSLNPSIIMKKGTDLRVQVLTFAAGAGLLWSGLSSAPLKEALMAAGGSLIVLAYAFVLGARMGRLTGAGPKLPCSPPSGPNLPESLPSQVPNVRLKGFLFEILLSILMTGAGLFLVFFAISVIGSSSGLFASPFIPGAALAAVGVSTALWELYHRPKPAVVKRFCMHCGFQMSTIEIACGRCHRQPPSGVDTRICPNCSSVIPALAKFCKDCGAGQTT